MNLQMLLNSNLDKFNMNKQKNFDLEDVATVYFKAVSVEYSIYGLLNIR